MQAPAQDLADITDATSDTTNPLYLPKQGQLSGTTQYTFGRTRSEGNGTTPASSHSTITNTNTVGQQLSYGVTDDFAINVQDTYQWGKTDNDFANGHDTGVHNDGFTDPQFGFTWRILDQRNLDPVNVDIMAAYAPNWIDSQSAASPTDDGSVARGGQMAMGQVNVGYTTGWFTIAGDAGISYFGSRETYNPVNNQQTNYTPNWAPFVGFNTQTYLTEIISVNAGVRETFNTNDIASNQTTMISGTNEPGNETQFTAALNYIIVPDRLAVGLTYGNNLYGSTKMQYANPVANNWTHDQDENIFGVRLQYVFF